MIKNNYYSQFSKPQLEREHQELLKEYTSIKNQNFSIDMTRGKPCKEQLNLSMKMMDILSSGEDFRCEDGTDCRNYGVLEGINECKRLISEIIEVDQDNIFIFGNSSLRVMFDCISHAYLHGVCGNTPWKKLEKIKWLCPVPGYDRHFAICEYFGMEMINIPMDENGPDMDMIEDLVSKDDSIKGIWCVPKYSNPSGITYSNKVVKRFAKLKPAAKDFRIYWDNAYNVHHLFDDNQDFLIELFNEAKKYNNEDIVYKFFSTSKISFPGSGIAALAASKNNLNDIKNSVKIQTIGYDKVNQLRHVRFFKDVQNVKKHMSKHAEILRPKFGLVNKIFEEELREFDIATWTKPHGGYFISLNVLPGNATRVVEICSNMGIKLTPAGSAFPYHKDPKDENIRIAPSCPSLEELNIACSVIVLAIKMAVLEKMI